jgi:hypothetical protein
VPRIGDGSESQVYPSEDEFPDVRRLKGLERENAQLKKLVADQALDIAMLKEVAKGNF